MHRVGLVVTVAGCCAVGATTLGTGYFKANTAAVITVKPVTFISGTVPDTTYNFTVKKGDSIPFSLPVQRGVGIVAGGSGVTAQPHLAVSEQRLLIDGGTSMAGGSVTLSSLLGREIVSYAADPAGRLIADLSRFAPGLYILSGKSPLSSFTARMNLDGTSGGAKLVSCSGTAPVDLQVATATATTATYRLDAKSSDPAYGDLSNMVVTVKSGANGTKIVALPMGGDSITTNFMTLLDSATYEKLFPKRYGLGKANSSWDTSANPDPVSSDGKFDFFTYRSLIAGLKAISDIRVEIWVRDGGGADYAAKVKWFNKKTGKSMEFITHEDFNAEWNLELKEVKIGDVDFAKFCAEGDLSTRKRELAAFLANISHETTGMGEEEPKKIWGLYWREEVVWQEGSTALGYIDPNSKTYPPYPNKSYHGRGPIQISYNTNYGQVSEFLFGDKNILLKQPELVLTTDSDKDGVQDAMLAFQAAIWFWMYPQAPKPSCHDVMVGNWKPSAEDIKAGRDKSIFGMTINVINGGQECFKGDKLSSPIDRIGFYKSYAQFMGVDVEDYCNCGTMKYWD